MKNLGEEKQREAFHDSDLFHHTGLVLNQLTEEVQEIVPQHQTHSDAAQTLTTTILSSMIIYFHTELTSH